MTKPMTLREKIDDRIEFLSLHWTTDDKSPFDFGGWKQEVIDQILQAIKEYCEELIGEDEEIEDFGGKVYTKETRNQLRQELRQKLKEDLG